MIRDRLLFTTSTTPAKAMTIPSQPSAGRRRPPIQARIAEKAVVVVITIEPMLGEVRDMPRPQQAWKTPTPTTDSTIIGNQSRCGSAIGLRIDCQYREQEQPGDHVARAAVEQRAHGREHFLGERIARAHQQDGYRHHRLARPAPTGLWRHCFGAVDAFCAPQKPNRAPATRRIWISSEPSVMR